MFVFLFFTLLFVAFVFTIRKTKDKLLNRDQTEEWKGWMQVKCDCYFDDNGITKTLPCPRPWGPFGKFDGWVPIFQEIWKLFHTHHTITMCLCQYVWFFVRVWVFGFIFRAFFFVKMKNGQIVGQCGGGPSK